jgi:hypothetical protein
LQGTLTEAAPLSAGQQPLPAMSEASGLLREEHVRALAAAVPARFRQARWTLLYATARDGISLQTLLRNAGRRAPTLLVVRDFDRWGQAFTVYSCTALSRHRCSSAAGKGGQHACAVAAVRGGAQQQPPPGVQG